MIQGQAACGLAVLAPAVAGIGTAVGAQALVSFEVDGNHPGPALGIVLGGRIGDEFNALELLGGESSQVVGQLGAGHGLAFAVDNHQHALAAPQAQVVARIQGHPRRAAQHVQGRGPGRQGTVGHVHHGTVGQALKLRFAALHGHFLQGRRLAGGQLDGRQRQAPGGQVQHRGPVAFEAHLRRRNQVAAARGFQTKRPLPVAELRFDHRRIGGSVQGDRGVLERGAGDPAHGSRQGRARLRQQRKRGREHKA